MTIPYVPGLDNVPSKISKVSSLDGKRGILAYRGYSIEQLSEKSNFEETIWLLLYGELPNKVQLKKFSAKLIKFMAPSKDLIKLQRCLNKKTHPMKALQIAVSAIPVRRLLLADYKNDDKVRVAIENQCVLFLAQVASLTASFERIRSGKSVLKPNPKISFASNFYYQLFGKLPNEVEERMIDACLILHAEHTMNASTFATMVCGSTLSEAPFVISTGIATLAGPLHGGANERVVHMLKEIPSVAKARDYIKSKLSKKEVIWGMGHREYKVKDPRANVLQKLLYELKELKKGKIAKGFDIAVAVEKICEELLAHKGVFPNVDFYSGILYRELKVPIDQYTPLFAVSRTSGWLAHWLEQIESNKIFRPTQVYEGSDFREYVPLDQREG